MSWLLIAVLGEEPIQQARRRADLIPDIMPLIRLLGISRISACFFDGIDHISGVDDRNVPVPGAMEGPYGYPNGPRGKSWIASPADRYCGCKHFRAFADEIPCSKSAP